MKKLNKNLINFLKDYDLTLKVETAEDMLSIQFYSGSTMVTNADYYLDTNKLSLDFAFEHDLFFYPNEVDSFDYTTIAYRFFKQNSHLIDKLEGQTLTHFYLISF